jgi:NADPH:quinone reductase-like Zn-dependent oxidoreductase
VPVATEVRIMRALVVSKQAQPVVSCEEVPEPVVGIGDVLVEVTASSFTPTELGWPSTWVDRAGRPRQAAVVGHEVCGTVRALGYGTTGLAVGDEVWGVTDWYRDGSAADRMAVEARDLSVRPSSLSPVEAAALRMGALTAWQALFVHGGARSGLTVVVNGASGGIGTAVVQLAHHAGLRVVALARSWARPLMGELGADEVIDTDSDSDDSSADGADLLIDLVGGGVTARSATHLRDGAPIVSIVSPQSPVAPEVPYRFFVVEPDRPQLAEVARLVDGGRLRPVVGGVVDLTKGADAFKMKGAGGVAGKIVLRHEAS